MPGSESSFRDKGIRRFRIEGRGETLHLLGSKVLAFEYRWFDEHPGRTVDTDDFGNLLRGPEGRECAWSLPPDDRKSAALSSQASLSVAQYPSTSRQDCQDVTAPEEGYTGPFEFGQQLYSPNIVVPSGWLRYSVTSYTMVPSNGSTDDLPIQSEAPSTHPPPLRETTQASVLGRGPSNKFIDQVRLVSWTELPSTSAAGAPNTQTVWKVNMSNYGIDWIVTTSPTPAGDGTEFHIVTKYTSARQWNLRKVVLSSECTKRRDVSVKLPQAEDAEFWPPAEFHHKNSQTTIRSNLTNMIEALRYQFGHSPLKK